MNTTVIKEIIAFVFGRKYYANIIHTKGTMKQEVSCYIFANKEAANMHRDSLADNFSYGYVETVSFRSHAIDFGSVIKS